MLIPASPLRRTPLTRQIMSDFYIRSENSLVGVFMSPL